MPIYEYQCRACANRFEELVRLSTRPEEVPCPECGQHQAERRMSAFAARVGESTLPCGVSESVGAPCCAATPGSACSR